MILKSLRVFNCRKVFQRLAGSCFLFDGSVERKRVSSQGLFDKLKSSKSKLGMRNFGYLKSSIQQW